MSAATSAMHLLIRVPRAARAAFSGQACPLGAALPRRTPLTEAPPVLGEGVVLCVERVAVQRPEVGVVSGSLAPANPGTGLPRALRLCTG